MKSQRRSSLLTRALSCFLVFTMLPIQGLPIDQSISVPVAEEKSAVTGRVLESGSFISKRSSFIKDILPKEETDGLTSIEAFDYTNKNVKILDIYPTADWIKSAFSTYIQNHPLPDGLSFTIDTVLIDTFNQNPDAYLLDENGNYKYDAVFVGASDSNGYKDISGLARVELQEYIQAGYGFLIGHDTICFNDYGTSPAIAGTGAYAPTSTITPANSTHWNMDALILSSGKISFTNSGWVGDSSGDNSMHSDCLRIRQEGQVVEYPYNLLTGVKTSIDGGNYYMLDAYVSHSNTQFAFGDIWVDYSSRLDRYYNTINAQNGITGSNNFYLATSGNIGMCQLGHRNCASDDEIQLSINALIYLSQPVYCPVCNDEQTMATILRDTVNLKTAIANDPDGCFVLGNNLSLPADWEPITGFTGHFSKQGYIVDCTAVTDPAKQKIFADSGRVEGIITDSQGHPLSFLDVTITGDAGTFSAVTDKNGKYSISSIPAGQYALSAEGEVVCASFQLSATEEQLPILVSGTLSEAGVSVDYSTDLTGMTGEKPNTIYTIAGKAIPLSSCPFSRDQFEFAGWNDGTGTWHPEESYTVNGNVDFIAVFIDHRDLTVPEVTSLLPASGKLGPSASLRISAKDNVGVAYVSAYYAEAGSDSWTLIEKKEASQGSAEIIWNTAGLNGTYQIKAAAEDTSGNISIIDYIREYTVDTTGISQIQNLQVQDKGSYILLNWEDVADSDFAYFQIERSDGGEYKSIGTESAALFYRVTDFVPNTEYSFRVVGYDNVGNRGEVSAPVTIVTSQDTVKPVIVSVLPALSAYSSSIPFEIKVSDNSDVGNLSIAYSQDRTHWISVTELTTDSTEKEYTFSYAWDISSIPEGTIYVRISAADAAGNTNYLPNGQDVVASYLIDRTAPDTISDAKADGTGGKVYLSWSAPADDTAYYQISRASGSSQDFTALEDEYTSIGYYDLDVLPSGTYTYKVRAIDAAGNAGPESAPVTVAVESDTKAPYVRSISPSNGSKTAANPTIQILAMDNSALRSISLEQKDNESGNWTEIAESSADGLYSILSTVWDTSGYQDGEYSFRAKVVDNAGNACEPYEFTLILDTSAPAAPVLLLTQQNWQIELSWADIPAGDLDHYEIYRKSSGDSSYTLLASVDGTKYTDTSVKPEVNYCYYCLAADTCGNTSQSNTAEGYAFNNDTISPTAYVTDNVTTMEGMSFAIDGTASKDNVGIKSYSWDMSDGTTLTGSQIVYSYSKAGYYTVTLTVSDEKGNTGTAYCTVHVFGKTEAGSATIRVTDTQGVPLSNASVYLQLNAADNACFETDGNGEVTIFSAPGTYAVAAYKTGYLPAENTVTIAQGKQTLQVITLSEGQVISGSLTSHRMSLAEMLSAGIDFDSLNNTEVFKFKLTLTFKQTPIPTEYIFYGTKSSSELVVGKCDDWQIQFDCLDMQEDENGNPVPILAYISTQQQVSWLKDMYSVDLGVINNASSNFYLDSSYAQLSLPGGVTLADTKSGSDNTLTKNIGVIPGGTSVSASWAVTSEAAGTYDIGASFAANLMPFSKKVAAQFTTQITFEPSGSGLSLYIYPEQSAYIGEKYYVQFALKNTAEKAYYNVQTDFGDPINPGSKIDVTCTDTASGTTTTYQQETASFMIDAPSKCRDVPVLYNGSSISVKMFLPGDTLYGTFCTDFDAEGDPEKVYYQLIDSMVEDLSGTNTGINVIVSPISSHIVKYNQIIVDINTLAFDPVDYSTGAFLSYEEAISCSSIRKLALDMNYNSLESDSSGDLGAGWSDNYEYHLEKKGGNILVYTNPAEYLTFVPDNAMNCRVTGTVNENGDFVLGSSDSQEQSYTCISSGGDFYSLTCNVSGEYCFSIRGGQTYNFNSDGRLISIIDLYGNPITLSYSGNTVTVSDSVNGQSLLLTYEGERLVSAQDKGGRTCSFGYEGEYLTSYTDVSGVVTRYAYDLDGRLIQIIHSDGTIALTNTYDDKDRILTQDDADPNTPITTFAYEKTDSGNTKVTMTDSNGGVSTATMNYYGDVIRETNAQGAATVYQYDLSGRLICETSSDGTFVSYTYDKNGFKNSMTDECGNTTKIIYDDNGNINQVIAPNGITTNYTYSANNLLLSYVDSVGLKTTYTYDQYGELISSRVEGRGECSYTYKDGNLISESDYKGNLNSYTYDLIGNRISSTDREGNTTSYSYDLERHVTGTTNALGVATSCVYDDEGNVIKTTDANGNQTRFEYKDGILTKTIRADGTTLQHDYDAVGNEIQSIKSDGLRVNGVYDAAGNCLQIIAAGQLLETDAYDTESRLVSSTDANGNTTSYSYYPNGSPYQVSGPDGSSLLYTYNSLWELISVTDALGRTVSYEYDSSGRMICERNALGEEQKYTYDIYGNVVTVTDPNGNSIAYVYDANNNCITRTDAAGQVYHFEYDKEDRLISTWTMTASAGEVRESYSYDALGRTVKYTDAEGNTYKYTYDANGNVLTASDALGNVIQNSTYDSVNQLVSSSDALGNQSACSYDLAGRVLSVAENLNTDSEQNSSYTYDSLGRLTSVTDSAKGLSSNSYDAAGNVLTQTDPEGGATTFTYDTVNRLSSIADSLGNLTSYTYDKAGQLTAKENARGDLTNYTYDAAGQLTSMTDELGKISYTYDKNGNILTVTDESGTITREYDKRNLLTAYTDAGGNRIEYTYDELGNLITLTYPDGTAVHYSYDKTGLLICMTDDQNRVTKYSYDANGNLIQTLRPDGSTETIVRDKAGKMLSKKDVGADGVIYEATYTYDASGNIVSLTSANSLSALDFKETEMEYDSANRLIKWNGFSLVYDADGNMTYGPLNGKMESYVYDCRNRLVRAGDTSYTYDAENNRIGVFTPKEKTTYVVDSSSSLTQILLSVTYLSQAADGVYSETGTQTKYYYGNGLAAQSDSRNGYLTYHFDHLGSTAALTDISGKTVSRYAYGTYGELAQGDTQLTRFLYNGQYGVVTDANGLYQMRARYYSPDLKRFVNQDVLLGAITNSQSLNRYAYTNGNPINRLDPFGLCAAMLKNLGHLALNLLSTILLLTPIAPLGAVLAGINAVWYFYDGDILGGLCSLGIVLGGVGGLIGGTAGLIMSGCGNLLLAGTSTWSAGQSIGKMYMDYQETGKINPWDVVSATMNLGMAAMGGYGAFKSFASIPALGRVNSKLESAWNARKTLTELKYKPSSGAILEATSNKTTTIIGGYEKDMKYIVNEMGNVKSTYFGANEGGFNVLNVPDDMYKNADQFWNDINVKWLDEAIARDDVFIMATKPTEGATSFIDINTGTRKLTGFGREYEYLTGKGYVYDEISKKMIK